MLSATVSEDKLEHGPKPANVADRGAIGRAEGHGEALKRGETACRRLPRGNPAGVLEHGPCRHPLAAVLATAMDLEAVVQVDCSAGCGHRLYAYGGPVECPCRLSESMVGDLERLLDASRRRRSFDRLW